MPKARKPSHMISSPTEIYSGHVQLYSNSVQIVDVEAVYLNRTLKVSEGLSKQLYPTLLQAKEKVKVFFDRFIFFDLLQGSGRPSFILVPLSIERRNVPSRYHGSRISGSQH